MQAIQITDIDLLAIFSTVAELWLPRFLARPNFWRKPAQRLNGTGKMLSHQPG